VLTAVPKRKPYAETVKDEDSICHGVVTSGKQYSDPTYEDRFRFLDIIVNRLNTRRAIREIVSPQIAKLQKDVDKVLKELEEIKELLKGGTGGDTLRLVHSLLVRLHNWTIPDVASTLVGHRVFCCNGRY